MVLSVSSCISTRSAEENLTDLKTGQVAMVISGCRARYTERNIILADKDKKTSCMTIKYFS